MKYLKYDIIGFIIGVFLVGGIGIVMAASNNPEYASGDVLYSTDKNSNVENVKDALDDLYTKSDKVPFANKIMSLYTSDGSNNIYYHDGTGTYGKYEAKDYSYRYSGDNVNNYVCFGSDAATCPTDNLYRIIGVFKNSSNTYQVKLIKFDYFDRKLGNSSAVTSTVSASNYANYQTRGHLTNIPVYKINENYSYNVNNDYISYLNGINVKWVNSIDTHTWHQRVNVTTDNVALNIYNLENDKSVVSVSIDQSAEYKVEFLNPEVSNYSDKLIQAVIASSWASDKDVNSQVEALYLSDYMYGASPNNWNIKADNYASAKDANWIYMGMNEYLIYTLAEEQITMYGSQGWPTGYIIGSDGIIKYYGYDNYYYAFRPTFYLKSDVLYKSGSGTSSDPYRIAS